MISSSQILELNPFEAGRARWQAREPAFANRQAMASRSVAGGRFRDDRIPGRGKGRTLAGGRYRITAKLGEGGMGFVYRALDQNIDSEVVIKVPRQAMMDDPEFAGRFTREIRSLVKLSHPHIVKVTDVGTLEGMPFAVMQYLAGGSLEDQRPIGPGGQVLPVRSPKHPSAGSSRSPRRSTTSTLRGTSIATSSPGISCSTGWGTRSSAISAWPRCSRRPRAPRPRKPR